MDALNIFLIAGLIQGLLISIFSLVKGSAPSNLFFSGILWILCLSLINNLTFYPSYNSSEVTIRDFLIWEPITLIGPLSYFYLKSLFEKKFNFKKANYLHFLPVVVEIFPTIVAFTDWLRGSNSSLYFLNTYDDYIVIPQVCSLTIYLVLSWSYLVSIQSLADIKTYRWARDLVLGLSILNIIWIPFIILYLTNQVLLLNTVFFFPIYYPMVLFLYYLSVRIMVTNLTFRPNPFSGKEVEAHITRIHKILNEKQLYSQPDLNLKKLSEHVSVSEKDLSFIFNHSLKKGFKVFLNEYRVRHALFKIENGDLAKITLEGIAFEVGFSSRSTFYRAFKQVTGMDPTTYLKVENFVSKKVLT